MPFYALRCIELCMQTTGRSVQRTHIEPLKYGIAMCGISFAAGAARIRLSKLYSCVFLVNWRDLDGLRFWHSMAEGGVMAEFSCTNAPLSIAPPAACARRVVLRCWSFRSETT